MTALRIDGVLAESAELRREPLTVWLSSTALTEWSGMPTQAFEIPRSMLRGATVIDEPRGSANYVALVASLHGRYVRWLFPKQNAETLQDLKAWVAELETSK